MIIAPEHLAAWTAFKEAVSGLHVVIERAPNEEAERRQVSLLAALNRLELAVLDLPNVDPDSDDVGDSPNTYQQWRSRVASAFPELGLYNSTDMRSVEPGEKITVSDAVNDLADILHDIDNALWRETRGGVEVGVWQVRFDYETHFGAHLADLRAYVYRQRFFGA